jgi:hypothetical protein
MKGKRVNPNLLRLTCALLGIGAVSCRPETLPATWSVQVEFIEGTPVDSAWVVLLQESQHSGNWQDGYALHPIGDTLHTDAHGVVCIPIQGLEGSHQLHIGRHGHQSGGESAVYRGSWKLPTPDAATVLLPTPFWIRCVGGRDFNALTGPNTIVLWSPYDFGPSEPASVFSFTPGAPPAPSLLLHCLIHPSEEFPISRMWRAAIVSPSGQLDTLPSLSLSIERHHLIDTMLVEQFW